MKLKIIVLFIMIAVGFWACSPHVHLDFLGKETIREVVLVESTAKEKIVMIDLDGVIGMGDGSGLFSREGDLVSRIHYRLKMAARDPLVKGIILRIDTPGGDGTASDIIYNEIVRFREKTGIPVLALMMGVAASGGYYAACGCDYIMAHPTTITGSIGVIAILPNFEKAMDKLGVKANVIKSGKMKDAGSPFKELGVEERAYMQEMVDNMYANFLQVVFKNRGEAAGLKMEEIKTLADGRAYHAQQALKLKLIDGIGYFDDALKQVLEEANIRDARVVAYTYYPQRKTNIYSTSAVQENPLSLEIKALEKLLPTLKTGIYYLWMPAGK